MGAGGLVKSVQGIIIIEHNGLSDRALLVAPTHTARLKMCVCINFIRKKYADYAEHRPTHTLTKNLVCA